MLVCQRTFQDSCLLCRKSLCAQRQHCPSIADPLLVACNEKIKKKKKKHLLGKFAMNPGDSTSFRMAANPFIRCFQQESVCRNVSLAGLGSVARCQCILCVGNRRLHYAQVVWVVNQQACFGSLRGNVEHLRKAAGLHSTVDPQKTRSSIGEALPERWWSFGTVRQSTCLCAVIVRRGYTRPFSVYFCGQTGWAAVPEAGNIMSQGNTKLFKCFAGNVAV